jgi:hypothetical protein
MSFPSIAPDFPHTSSSHVFHPQFSSNVLSISTKKPGNMSAIADSTDGPIEVIKVLFALYPGYNTLDVAGPLEILSRSLHNAKDKGELYHVSIQLNELHSTPSRPSIPC